MENTELICPKCKSKEVTKRGFRITDNRQKIQRYFCKSCKNRFVFNNAFYRMRNHDEERYELLDECCYCNCEKFRRAKNGN